MQQTSFQPLKTILYSVNTSDYKWANKYRFSDLSSVIVISISMIFEFLCYHSLNLRSIDITSPGMYPYVLCVYNKANEIDNIRNETRLRTISKSQCLSKAFPLHWANIQQLSKFLIALCSSTMSCIRIFST